MRQVPRAWRRSIPIGLASVVLALAGCGGDDDGGGSGGIPGGSEVALEPVSKPTANPFTPSVGRDRAKIRPPKAAASSGGPATYSASLPGLYGGTRSQSTCDEGRLVSYLEANPDKARAWSQTLGIATTDIRGYVGGLTSVILRTDTRVTNHGFVDGRANAIPALLEAGTAVLVDRYGLPVVKCYCGNPLTAALPLEQPRYAGTPWTGFSPQSVTIINQSTTIIQTFRLYDPQTGAIFKRPAGSTGGDDGPYLNRTPTRPRPARTLPSTTTTTPPTQTQPPPVTTTTEAQPPATEEPAASFDPTRGHVGDTYVLSVAGFAPDATLDLTLTRPDGVVEHETITTNTQGTGSFTFAQTGSDTPLGTYAAVVTNRATGASAQATTVLE